MVGRAARWGAALGLILAVGARADEPAADGGGTGHALIVVGLPGDDEHEARFRAVATAWRDWLAGPLGFPAGNVRVLFGKAPKDELSRGPATREAAAAEAKAIADAARPEDRLWVFVLGHANVDDGHAFLHLPGPDLDDDALAALFREAPCREQVFWITTPAAGWFLPALSARGRVVIAATGRTQEFNETEFPEALAEVAGRPRARLDRDGDGRISAWELFLAVAEAVEARFAADDRLPTEHAQLDDDGDGAGSEPPEPDAKGPPKDGELAKKTVLPGED